MDDNPWTTTKIHLHLNESNNFKYKAEDKKV